MKEKETRLREEVRRLSAEAEDLDAEEDARYGRDSRDDELPAELQRREDRLGRIREAKGVLQQRTREEARAEGGHLGEQQCRRRTVGAEVRCVAGREPLLIGRESAGGGEAWSGTLCRGRQTQAQRACAVSARSDSKNRNAAGPYETEAPDSCGPRHLCAAQGNHRTGLRPDQTGTGLLVVRAMRHPQGAGRMGSGPPRTQPAEGARRLHGVVIQNATRTPDQNSISTGTQPQQMGGVSQTRS